MSGQATAAATAINNYCKAKLSTFYTNDNTIWEDFATGHYLWSSTERVAGYPFYLYFYTDGILHLDGNYDKSNAGIQVRAVLAF